MLTSEQKEILHQQLLAELEELHSLTEHSLFSASETQSVGELSSIDNHPADLGTELFEREKDMALHAEFADQKNECMQAIQRLQNGTYGHCEVCDIEIPFERLEAFPEARMCIEHSAMQPFQPDHKPVEQSGVQIPSSVAMDMDLLVGFDGEDTWQAVAKYGSSETQADQDTHHAYDFNHMYSDSEEDIGIVSSVERYTQRMLEKQYQTHEYDEE